MHQPFIFFYFQNPKNRKLEVETSFVLFVSFCSEFSSHKERLCPTAIFIFNQGNKLPILARLLGCGFVRGVFFDLEEIGLF